MQTSPLAKPIAAGCSCYRFIDMERGGAEQLTAPTLTAPAVPSHQTTHISLSPHPTTEEFLRISYNSQAQTQIECQQSTTDLQKKKYARYTLSIPASFFSGNNNCFYKNLYLRLTSLYLRSSITQLHPRWDVLQSTTRQLLMAECRAAVEATVLLEYTS